MLMSWSDSTPMVDLASRHDGHQQKDTGYFTRNDEIARLVFWLVVLVIIALVGMIRLLTWHSEQKMTRICSFKPIEGSRHFRRSQTSFQRILNIQHWLFSPRHAILGYLPSVSQGEICFAAAYVILTWALLLTNVFFPSSSSPHTINWEVIGFRAAWMATTQLPLLFCTSGHVEPIKMVTGIADDTIKRFHALIGINLFFMLIIHWASFIHIWDLTHTIIQTFQQRSMVIWGFVAWSVFGTTIVLSLTSFRHRWYEPWLISHMILGFAGLLFSYVHTKCTTYFVMASLMFIVWNKLGKVWLFLRLNLHCSLQKPFRFFSWGYQANLELLNDQYLRLRINQPSFTWKPGQHIYLHIPQIRMFESHPFTIANSIPLDETEQYLTVVIKKQDGFTKSLFEMVPRLNGRPLRVNFLGPFGNVPTFGQCDTAIFIASGNRASFIFPLITNLCNNPGDVTTIVAHLIFSTKEFIDWYLPSLAQSYECAQQQGIKLDFIVHVTKAEEHPGDDFYSGNSFTERGDIRSEENADAWNATASIAEEMHQGEASRLLRSGSESDTTIVDSAHEDGHDSISTPDSTSSSTTTVHSSTYHLANSISGPEPSEKEMLQQLLTKDSDIISKLQVSQGRPTAERMINPVIKDTSSQSRVMVVAAVAPKLLQEISVSVSTLCKDIAFASDQETSGRYRPGVLRLWHESNGA